MRRKIWKILHIPSGSIIELHDSHSNGIRQFRQEFNIILDFAKEPITKEDEIQELHIITHAKLQKLGLDYELSENSLRNWCGFDFTDAVVDLELIEYDDNQAATDIRWEQINPSEFEILL